LDQLEVLSPFVDPLYYSWNFLLKNIPIVTEALQNGQSGVTF